MAHLRSKDPFEFVGKHVVRGLARAPHRQEHGWITRYDAEIDCYWLFVPGAGPPKRVPRAEVIKFVANPSIQVRDGDDDAFPPPVEDVTSRFVGVPVLKHAPLGASRRRRAAAAPVAGRVACFLPFADLYRVDFADGSSEEMDESAIVDSMIVQLTAPVESAARRPLVVDVDADEVRSRGRKRPRADPSASPEFEPVPELPSVVNSTEALAATAAGSREMSVSDVDNDAEDENYREFGAGAAEETAMSAGPPAAWSERTSILELDDAMDEFIPVDEGEAALQTESAARETGARAVEVVDSALAQPSSPRSPSTMPFYIIEDAVHTSVEPLDRRAAAFELLRQWLLNLLDRKEAGSRKTQQQYDVLRNTDIKDRDAIRRFIDADGLCVLSDLMAAFMEEETDEGHDDLYFMLKVVAMLPLPTFDQVMQANLGKTLNKVSKPSKDRRRPLPTCVVQLARWIKNRWKANIKTPDERPKSAPRLHTARPSRPMQKRRLYAPVASSLPRGPALLLAGTPAQNRMPVHEARPVNDPTPIPRLPRQTPTLTPTPTPTPPLPAVPSFAASRAKPSAHAAQYQPPQEPTRRGSLKPDWMRHTEELSRTRFTAQSDTQSDSTAERRHYQASHAAPAVGTKRRKNEDQGEDAGGPDGVYGRDQRLKFGKKWMLQSYDVSEPPTTVNRSGQRPAGGQWPSQPVRRFPPSSSAAPATRPILRQQSRYNDEPDL